MTKFYLKQSFIDFETRFEKKIENKLEQKLEQKLDQKFKEFSEDFKRHVSALSEDFQSKLSSVAEMTLDNKDKILYHDYIIRKHILKEKF